MVEPSLENLQKQHQQSVKTDVCYVLGSDLNHHNRLTQNTEHKIHLLFLSLSDQEIERSLYK